MGAAAQIRHRMYNLDGLSQFLYYCTLHKIEEETAKSIFIQQSKMNHYRHGQ